MFCVYRSQCVSHILSPSHPQPRALRATTHSLGRSLLVSTVQHISCMSLPLCSRAPWRVALSRHRLSTAGTVPRPTVHHAAYSKAVIRNFSLFRRFFGPSTCSCRETERRTGNGSRHTQISSFSPEARSSIHVCVICFLVYGSSSLCTLVRSRRAKTCRCVEHTPSRVCSSFLINYFRQKPVVISYE